MAHESASQFVALGAQLPEKHWDSGSAGRPKVEVQKAGKRASMQSSGMQKRARYAFKTPRFLASKRINAIVKGSFIKNNADARRHIAAHLHYLQNRERGELEREPRKIYNQFNKEVSRDEAMKQIAGNRNGRHAGYKITLSPGDNSFANRAEVTQIMNRWQSEAGLDIPYVFVEHKNTDHHHAHILMQGTDSDGNGYVITRDHLDLLRSIANERQYRVQERNMEYDKALEQELSATYEEALHAYERYVHDLNLNEITGRNVKAVDQIARSLIDDSNRRAGRDTRDFDVYQFRREIDQEIYLRQKQLEQAQQNGPADVLFDRDFDPAKAQEEAEKSYFENKAKEDLLQGAHRQLTEQEKQALGRLFKEQNPEEARLKYLRDAEVGFVESHPYLRASYNEKYEDYYMARLQEEIARDPNLSERYRIDENDPLNDKAAVLSSYLDDFPQIAPELLDINPLGYRKIAPFMQRAYASEDIVLAQVPVEDSLRIGDTVWTKYHTLAELQAAKEGLDPGTFHAMQHSDYGKLVRFIHEKETRGEMVYGLPPGIDPEKVDRDVMEALKEHQSKFEHERIYRDILAYNEQHQKPQQWAVRFWQNPAQFLFDQMRAIKEHYPELMPEFKNAIADYEPVFDEFPEFLPGNEFLLAAELEKVQQQVGLDLAQKAAQEPKSDNVPADAQADRSLGNDQNVEWASYESVEINQGHLERDFEDGEHSDWISALENDLDASGETRDALYELTHADRPSSAKEAVKSIDPQVVRWELRDADENKELQNQKELIDHFMLKDLDDTDREDEDDSDRLFSQGDSR